MSNRAFVRRAVRYFAKQGICQSLGVWQGARLRKTQVRTV